MHSSTLRPPDFNKAVASSQSQTVDLDGVYSFSLQANYVDAAPAVKTFTSDTFEVQTLTFPAFAGVTDGDYIVVENAAGVKYAVYADKTGSTVAPTGAIYLAATHKVKANISADTTAAQVAARFETAFNTLTGFTASITTDDTAADGTMTLTQIVVGPTTNPVPKNADDSGAGSLAGIQSTAGLLTTLSLSANTITITAHPYALGTKVALTTAGSLPTGLSATNYYVIPVDVNTIKLASSLANAVAGTAVDITTEGGGTHTLTAATSTSNVLKLQKSNDSTNWTDISSMTVTIATTTGTSLFEIVDPSYRYLRILYTPSAGQINLTSYLNIVRM
jgi:hypothetical protein